MAVPIDLYDEFAVYECEIRDMLEGRKEMLCTIPLTKLRDSRFQRYLAWCGIGIQCVPVPKERVLFPPSH